jgi:osmotically-inducible protein OsmY
VRASVVWLATLAAAVGLAAPATSRAEQVRRDEAKVARVEEQSRKAKQAVKAAARDTYITSATKLRLLADGRTPALDIDVDTNRGVVTLFGLVASNEEKAAAVEDARKVGGVRKVVDELEVVPSAQQTAVKARDEDVAREVEKAIAAHPSLGDASIRVAVRNGVARLSGTAADEHQRLSAARVAGSRPGVRSVQDDLQVGTGSR